MHRKVGVGDAVGKWRWSSGRFLEISAPFSRITHQEGIFERNSGKPLLHALFLL